MKLGVARRLFLGFTASVFGEGCQLHKLVERSLKMATPKTKAQIIAKIAEDAEITKKQATAALESLVTTAYKGAKSKDGFTIPGIGKLIKVRRKARMGRNPATGETIKIKAKTVLKFRIAKAAKDAVLG
jgi:DNA-binding protein HU-beta